MREIFTARSLCQIADTSIALLHLFRIEKVAGWSVSALC
jgi:hypothetical protein